MNHSHRVLPALIVVLGVFSGNVLAQGIPRNVRAGEVSGAEGTIKQVIDADLKKLAEGDPQAQQQARESLTSGSISRGDAANYRAVYARTLGAAILPLLDHKDLRVRLNAAIVVQRVADAAEANSTALDKAVLALLDDKQPVGVKIWAMKAAKPVLAGLVAINQHKDFLGRIVPAVQGSNLAGPVTEEAYEALKLPNPAAVEEYLKLLTLRVGAYRDGVPSDPHVEADPFAYFVSSDATWNLLAQPGQLRLMQLACNVSAYAANSNVASGSIEREQVQRMLQRVASATAVVGQRINDKNLAATAGRVAQALGQRNANLPEAVKPLCPAIKTANPFASITLPNPNAPK
jgi:hypothetical protein